jgi:hypothetical protein
MESNKKPYGQQYGVSMTYSEELDSFTTIHQKCILSFKKNGGWMEISEVPGTLNVTCTSSDTQPKVYTVSGTFRVAYASEANQQLLDEYSKRGCILMYHTGGGNTKVAGTKANPLTLKYDTVDGFDGYEVTISGTQTTPESFITE